MSEFVFGDKLASSEEERRFVELYETAFPITERDPAAQVLRDLDDRRRTLLVARSDGELVGFLVYLVLKRVSLAFVEYLAVLEALRGQGVGSALLEELRHRLSSHAPPVSGSLFEIDRVEDATGDERRRRARRHHFFERAGAVVVEGLPRIEVPNLAGPGAIGLTLMWLPTAPALPPPVDERLREAVTAILVEGYGLSESDPLVVRNSSAVSR